MTHNAWCEGEGEGEEVGMVWYVHSVRTHTYILNGKGFLPTSDQNAMVCFRTMRPEHSEHIGKVFSLFLAGIEEPFTVHATAC